MSARHWAKALFAWILLAPLGCGTPIGPVTGRIMIAGQPLKGGCISFVPKENLATPPVSGIIQDDGTFSVADVPFGEMVVAIIPPPPVQSSAGSAAVQRKRMIERNRHQGLPPPPEAQAIKPQNAEPAPELVPKMNQDPLTTDITFLHDAANATFNYEFK